MTPILIENFMTLIETLNVLQRIKDNNNITAQRKCIEILSSNKHLISILNSNLELLLETGSSRDAILMQNKIISISKRIIYPTQQVVLWKCR